jgi:SHS2 domain-containing protein
VKQFEFLEHTADKGAIAYGASLAQLFENGALSMVSLMCDVDPSSAVEWRRVAVDAADLGNLFVRWLSELVWLVDVESLLPVAFEVEEATATSLRARVGVAPVDRETFVQRGAIVKAITYHDLEVAETDEGWHARYYVDV